MKVSQILPLIDCVIKLYDSANDKYYDGLHNNTPIEYRSDTIRCIESEYADQISLYTEREGQW